ncbi:MAG: DUF262 domain-containing protein [Magnetococcales bacterium]|nr:DUF262 domain-containing protein [Magnetococcales bacterium]
MAFDDQRIPECKTEIVSLPAIMLDMQIGKLRILDFHRPFVWGVEQMIGLLDSIRKQYPTGSLVVWETDYPLQSRESVGPVHIGPSESRAMHLYLLDGQQRLTTLLGCFLGRHPRANRHSDDPRWRMVYNAKNNFFEHLEPSSHEEVWHFPLFACIDTLCFLQESQRMRREGGQHGEAYVERVQSLARLLHAYRIPLIRIRNAGLADAIEIAVRLNTHGQTMTALEAGELERVLRHHDSEPQDSAMGNG